MINYASLVCAQTHGEGPHCDLDASCALRRALDGRSSGGGFLIVSFEPSSVSGVMRRSSQMS